jgi:hypothetical protein
MIIVYLAIRSKNVRFVVLSIDALSNDAKELAISILSSNCVNISSY